MTSNDLIKNGKILISGVLRILSSKPPKDLVAHMINLKWMEIYEEINTCPDIRRVF